MRALLATLALAGCGVTLGDAPVGRDGTAASCKHVDVVLAVDNAGSSTQKEQMELRQTAFPAFASALLDMAGGIDDFRVGLVDGCTEPASFHTRGITRECNFAGGHVWMESSSPSLANEIDCVANIDSRDAQCSGGDNEQPVTAAAMALEPAWAGPGKPNAGFSRSDALLVVVALTAEDEQPVPNASAEDVYDRLVATKGDVNKMVFVGIGGESNCDNSYGGADDADKLQDVTRMFRDDDRGVFVDLCEDDLAQGLAATVDTIESACEDFL
jgi:hypothetical protein